MRRLLIVPATLLLACTGGLFGDPDPVLRVEPPAEVELAVGQTVTFPGDTPLTLTFRGVDSDSRCPEDVQCVWAGDAAVHFDVSDPASAELVLHTPTTSIGPRVGFLRGLQIELLELTPAPRADTPRQRPYRVRLAITLRALP